MGGIIQETLRGNENTRHPFTLKQEDQKDSLKKMIKFGIFMENNDPLTADFILKLGGVLLRAI